MTVAHQWHAGFVNLADVVHLARLNETRGLDDLLRCDAIDRAALVIGAPLRGPPLGTDRCLAVTQRDTGKKGHVAGGQS